MATTTRKVVVNIDVENKVDRQKAMMKAAFTSMPSLPAGVDYVGVNIRDRRLIVIGEVNQNDVVSRITRKYRPTVESVGPYPENANLNAGIIP